MPCLNESETLATCIRHALAFFRESGISGEVVIADNGSTDGSQDIARAEGARVVDVHERGYGAALQGGIAAAHGRFVAMGDADDSYDFHTLGPFVDKLRDGADLVMGNRFAGGIEPGAMPPLHKYLGNPVLSLVGRTLFRTPVKDFHCGLRAFRKDSITALNLKTSGMEFASEMVVRASLANLNITEVPTTLRKDGRSRPPHLRSWRDGWRHLRFLMLYSPRWLFLYPGLLLTLIGLLLTIALAIGPITIGSIGLDVGTMMYATALTVVGYQSVLFALLSKVYAQHEGFLPSSDWFDKLQRRLNLENLLLVGLGIFAIGIAWSISSVFWWQDAGFGQLDTADSARAATPGVLGLVLGVQTMMAGMFLSLLRIRVVHPELEVAPQQ
jgi:hypothetical protein